MSSYSPGLISLIMVEGNLEPRKEDPRFFMTILCLLSNLLTKVSAKIKLKGIMWTVYVVWGGTYF